MAVSHQGRRRKRKEKGNTGGSANGDVVHRRHSSPARRPLRPHRSHAEATAVAPRLSPAEATSRPSRLCQDAARRACVSHHTTMRSPSAAVPPCAGRRFVTVEPEQAGANHRAIVVTSTSSSRNLKNPSRRRREQGDQPSSSSPPAAVPIVDFRNAGEPMISATPVAAAMGLVPRAVAAAHHHLPHRHLGRDYPRRRLPCVPTVAVAENDAGERHPVMRVVHHDGAVAGEERVSGEERRTMLAGPPNRR